jgi:hypothetical protein
MKYKRLSSEELHSLEKEFVDFLVANGIVASDWESIKSEKKAEAEQIINHFSDVIFEGIMRKVNFLEFRDSKKITIFQCLEKKLVSVTMDASKIENANLLDNSFISQAVSNPPEKLEVFTSEKDYEGNREEELFKMTEKGCFITDDKLFKTLCLAL